MRLIVRRRMRRGAHAPAVPALLLVLLLAACSPRETPPQLAYTPAPAYTLSDRLLTTDVYAVEPPAGWRVIAGPAEDPYTFQFVAPENTAIILVSDHDVAEPPVPLGADAAAISVQTVRADEVYVILIASEDAIEALSPVRDAVVTSLR